MRASGGLTLGAHLSLHPLPVKSSAPALASFPQVYTDGCTADYLCRGGLCMWEPTLNKKICKVKLGCLIEYKCPRGNCATEQQADVWLGRQLQHRQAGHRHHPRFLLLP